MTHELKTWPEFFQAIIDGRKPFELRKNDRNFRVGDHLLLREWDCSLGESGDYTGRQRRVEVTYILSDLCNPAWGLRKGYAILGISKRIKAE